MGAILSGTPAGYAADWGAWHEEHERRRASEHGFLAVTSIRWLTPTPERFEDAPGAWSTGEDGPVVELAEGEVLEIDGKTVTGIHRFGPLPDKGGVTAYWAAPSERVAIEVARRGDQVIVRPRHPGSPIRRAYTGTPTFDPNLRYVVDAHFEPFSEARDVTVGSVVESLHPRYEAPGLLTFDLDGPRSLLAFAAPEGRLHVLFTDRTSGVSTYPAVRTLTIDAPDTEGRTRIDFNRATNLPCAYTPYATCPLPPPENRLDVAIEAGEQWKR